MLCELLEYFINLSFLYFIFKEILYPSSFFHVPLQWSIDLDLYFVETIVKYFNVNLRQLVFWKSYHAQIRILNLHA